MEIYNKEKRNCLMSIYEDKTCSDRNCLNVCINFGQCSFARKPMKSANNTQCTVEVISVLHLSEKIRMHNMQKLMKNWRYTSHQP